MGPALGFLRNFPELVPGLVSVGELVVLLVGLGMVQ